MDLIDEGGPENCEKCLPIMLGQNLGPLCASCQAYENALSHRATEVAEGVERRTEENFEAFFGSPAFPESGAASPTIGEVVKFADKTRGSFKELMRGIKRRTAGDGET